MGAIKLLDKSVYELIAAGEVIERPSSVVKEMLENSIDAKANVITVEIKNGGRTYIRITDNGCGMSKEDIPLAFMRHATSKISTQDDLNGIMTLGFRGEALASICAVSRVDVITKRKEDDLGWHYRIEGGEELEFEESGCPNGTTFIIRDIFFNVPARLKFLKKDVSEGNSIAAIIQKLALSHPEISFKFIRDNKTELITSGDGKLFSAIYSVFGKAYADTMIPVDYSLGGISVKGYVTKPLSAKANRTYQNFFVNSRYVKSVTCMVALEEAFRNQIMVGKFPGCVLNVSLNPDSTDVNVHPAKIEIRFSNEKPVYDAVYFAVKNSLMNFDRPIQEEIPHPTEHKLTREEVFSKPEPTFSGTQLMFNSAVSSFEKPIKKDESEGKTSTRIERSQSFEVSEKQAVTDYDAEKIFDSKADVSSTETKPVASPEIKQEKLFEPVADFKYINSSSFVKKKEKVSDIVEEKPRAEVKLVGEIFKTYIVCEVGTDVYLIDKHAAHERINFEKIKQGERIIESQNLLSPITVNLGYDEYDAVCEHLDICENYGFAVQPKAAPQIEILAVPVLISQDDPVDLISKLAEILINNKNVSGDELFDDLYHSIACKASIKANSVSNSQELLYLANQVIAEDIRYCPHGRPVLVKLTKYEIEKMFKRIV